MAGATPVDISDPLAMPSVASLEQAYIVCERLARSHYENFNVVTGLLPRSLRRPMFAVYAFCRATDDLGDEAPGDRLALLQAWEEDLRRCYGDTPRHPYLIALQDTVRTYDIPIKPFLKLIEANRMDQRVHRYRTYADLLHYCEHSANPVGRMVLYVFGHRDVECQRLSDCTCTALQLANFWQGVRQDYERGRIYLPLEDMARYGCTEDALARGVLDGRFQALMRFEVERARELFARGQALVPMVSRDLRVDLKLFTLGGLAILDAIERQGYDVFSREPRVPKARRFWLVFRALVELWVGG
ncbi:MAG: squalene synthase HpnC, partial [Chloroflexi bacterium]|nr:squalene synthase HpnC [Chloroflexota bacterium]